MERWYIAFNTVGSPHDILNKLVQAVRHHKLGDFVVRFCYEKGVRKGQFYVFVGVASEEKGIIPTESYNEFHSMIKRLRLRDDGLYVYFDEVQRMVTKELEIHNLRQIKMLKPTKLPPTDPFNYASRPSTVKQDASLNEAYNKLIYWLSAYGRGTWQQFNTACKELGLDPEGEYSRRIMRRLRSLGHVELTKDGQNWFIAPPALVAIDSEGNEYPTFLTGLRSNVLLDQLQHVARIEFEIQPDANAPETVRVTFGTENDVIQFVQYFSAQHHSLYFAGIASLKIASTLPDLSEWQKYLSTFSIVRGNYDFEQLIDGSFQKIHLPNETGLYRLTHVSTKFEHPQLTLFYDEDTNTWHKGDWYGLRYLMLRKTGQPCDFHYDHNLKKLSIALENRLPDMYERALVLASGRLPIFRNDYLIFGGVSETLAHILANKLEAEFIEYKGI